MDENDEATVAVKHKMPVKVAVDLIQMAIDTKMRKTFFPTKAWIANYSRPFIPTFVDRKLIKMAKL